MQKKLKNFFSLYVHVPFCAKKCLFCSFAVSVGQGHRADEYIDALKKEILAYGGTSIASVYLGGGTPSFLSLEQMARLVDGLRVNFDFVDGGEWTLEANPEGLDPAKAAGFKSLGFNRISLGVQSFNDAYLKFLGRAHGRAVAVDAFQILRGAGFDNINVDLMYGFPGQTRQELEADLRAVAQLESEHVSIYTLTIEPRSRFYATQMKLDDDEKLADDYVRVTQFLEQAGLKQYEVSNFARAGFESRHNLVYWEGGDYIGVGMGAHSLHKARRSWNTENLSEYLSKIRDSGQAEEDGEDLSTQKRLLEGLVFGLRTNRGVSIPLLEKQFKLNLPGQHKILIDEFVQGGFLVIQDGYVRTTLNGRLVLDELSKRLI